MKRSKNNCQKKIDILIVIELEYVSNIIILAKKLVSFLDELLSFRVKVKVYRYIKRIIFYLFN